MTTLYAPYAATATTLPARVFDPRLSERGVAIQGAVAAAGQSYWRLVVARWFSEQEAGGRHHLYVESLDEGGRPLAAVPFRVGWPSGSFVVLTNGNQGVYASNYPMSPSRNEFDVAIVDGAPSERVTGLGMGAMTPDGYNAGIHTATLLVFQRTTAGGQTAPPPVPVEPPPLPPTPDPILDALAQARHYLDTAMQLYSRRGGG